MFIDEKMKSAEDAISVENFVKSKRVLLETERIHPLILSKNF